MTGKAYLQADVQDIKNQENPVVCREKADTEVYVGGSKPLNHAPDDRFLTGEPSNTVRARVPWQAQPYMMSGKYASRGLLRCLETFVWCEMRCLCWERVMCERKAKKDAPATVVSRAACVSRAPLADASRLARSRPAWSLRVNLLSTIHESFFLYLANFPPVRCRDHTESVFGFLVFGLLCHHTVMRLGSALPSRGFLS